MIYRARDVRGSVRNIGRRDQPRRLSSGLLAILLLAGGCNSQPAPAASGEAGTAPNNEEEVRQTANRRCITTALNNTLYKRQSDSELEAALFSQNLDQCSTDFVQAYVAMRQAARDYLAAMREVIAHQGGKDTAYQVDGLNILCSIIQGSQCFNSAIQEWSNVDEALKGRVSATKARMDAGKDEVERVAASYGLYATTAPSPEGAPEASGTIS